MATAMLCIYCTHVLSNVICIHEHSEAGDNLSTLNLAILRKLKRKFRRNEGSSKGREMSDVHVYVVF